MNNSMVSENGHKVNGQITITHDGSWAYAVRHCTVCENPVRHMLVGVDDDRVFASLSARNWMCGLCAEEIALDWEAMYSSPDWEGDSFQFHPERDVIGH